MKRNWVKGLAVACIVVLAATVFAACGSKEEPKQQAGQQEEQQKKADGNKDVGNNEATGKIGDEKQFANKELNIAVFEGGFGKAYWEEIVKRFEADYPGVKVNMTSNPKIMDVIKPQLVAGNPPDFIYVPLSDNSKTIDAMIRDKALLDMTDVFESKALDKDVLLKDVMIDGILDYAKPHDDGKIYYAPFNLATLGIWYNQALFESKGWEVPATWDQFFALGETAKQENRSLFTYQGIYPSYNEIIAIPSIASAGGMDAIKNVMNYEENAFKSDAVKKTFDVFNTIAQKGYLMPGTVALNHAQAQTEFLKGKALFIPNGNWFESEMKDAPREEGFKFGFMAPPVFQEGDQRYAYTSFDGLFIPLKAKNPELAKAFIKYQFKDDSVKLNAEKSSGIAAVKNGAEMAKPFVPESVYNSVKVFDNGVKPILFQWKVTPKTEIVINDEVYNPINNIMNKKMTVDEWINRADKASTKLRELIEKSKS